MAKSEHGFLWPGRMEREGQMLGKITENGHKVSFCNDGNIL